MIEQALSIQKEVEQTIYYKSLQVYFFFWQYYPGYELFISRVSRWALCVYSQNVEKKSHAEIICCDDIAYRLRQYYESKVLHNIEVT